MEMDDRALQHIMDLQTRMLQQIETMQRENTFNKNGSPISGHNEAFNHGIMPDSIASAGIPPSYAKNMMFTPPPMSISDPTAYGTYASPYGSEGRLFKEAKPNLFEKGLFQGTLAEMRDFDPTKHSKEETAQFLSQQTRSLQEKAVGTAGGVVGGAAAAGSFFVPGLLPSLAAGGAVALGVGGVTAAFVNETKTALDYQDLLQRQSYRFMNAFESTNELGGIGMGLEDRQDVSRFLRELAPEKFLEDKDMMSILEGATNNKLMRTVTDVKSFKDKFSQVVDAVKEITITMDQTIEEATEFMGELERRGIATKDMAFVAAQSKVMSSTLGISSQDGANLILSTSDQVTQGTRLDAGNVMRSSSESVFYAQSLQDWAQVNNEDLYHLIKNSGGGAGVGALMETSGRQYLQSKDGTDYLLGMYASGFDRTEEGSFAVNAERMQELLSGMYSVEEMQRMSREFTNQLSVPDKHRLQGTASTSFSQYASNREIAQFMDRNAQMIQEKQANAGRYVDKETALVESGIANDYEEAMLLSNMIEITGNEDLSRMYNSKVFKEEQDSHAISTNPSMFKRLGFWWEENVTNQIGNKGQDISDFVGREMMDYQKFITGIDDRSMVNAPHLENFDAAGLDKLIDRLGTVNESNAQMYDFLGEKQLEGYDASRSDAIDKLAKGDIDLEGLKSQLDIRAERDGRTRALDANRYNMYLTKANDGTLSAADLAVLKQREDLGFAEEARLSVIEREMEGKYEGISGKMKYGFDRLSTWGYGTAQNTIDFMDKRLVSPFRGDTSERDSIFGDTTMKSLEKQQEQLIKERRSLTTDLANLFSSGDLGSMQYEKMAELEEAIKSGDSALVKGITSNKDALDLTSRYKEAIELESGFEEGMGAVKETSMYTKALATSGTQLRDMLNASGLYSEAEIDNMVGTLTKKGKKTNKKLEKGKLSAEDMIHANAEMLEEIDMMFDMMPNHDMNQFAQYLTDKDPSIRMDQLFKEGTSVIDADKLQNYVMNDIVRNQHLNKEPEKADKKDANEAKAAAEEHTEAMHGFLTAFQRESEMLRDATMGRPIQTTYQTSLGTR